MFKRRFSQASTSFKLAACAAEYAEIMRNSYWARGSEVEDVIIEANELFEDTDDSQIREFIEMLSKTANLKDQLAYR